MLLITLPQVLWLFYNQAANWHFHRLENGCVMQHAHPYQKSGWGNTPFQDHKHTPIECSILSTISQIAWALWWPALITIGFYPGILKLNFPVAQPLARGVFSGLTYLRGPPAGI